ncbi:MAG TPA: septum site-determining protein MinC [Candidatus Atribacteria bacterium]|nr:septum site-determining protein MinC [Candidatus Atribacteria bacterium]HPT77653.1 septum site-determining protein MinC [Candidatus Atribacteria bacterium]
MTEKPVLFKGTRNGLSIYTDSKADISAIKGALEKKLQESRHFFNGTTVNLIFTGRVFSEQEQQDLIEISSRYITVGSFEFKGPESQPVQDDHRAVDPFESFNGSEEGMTRFIRGTVRNGQRILYNGNIVILGDVNPGAEIIAEGNILILGTIRGMAHAGAAGDTKAVVAAFCLQPTQLRIAGCIARAPEGEAEKPQYPEIAYIKNNQLVIEPYLPGKGK